MAALAGFGEALRRVPASLRRPESLILAMAIFASFGAHMPPYISLGALADYFEKRQQEQAASKPVEVAFEWSEPPAHEPEPEPAPSEPDDSTAPAPEPEERVEAEPRPEPPKPEASPPEPEKTAKLELLPEPPPPPPPEAAQRKQSIEQKSDDPNVEPPPEARFVADEARRVEEETVAMVRDDVRDDPEPEAAAPQDRGVDEAGGDEQDNDGHHDVGEEQGEKVAETTQPEQRPEPTARAEASSPSQPRQPAREAAVERKEAQAKPALPGTVIQDPLGSFTLAAAEEPRVRQRGQQARAGRSASGGERRPNLNVSWKVFEDTYDAETLAAERVPKRRQRAGSSMRKQRWKEFRAAIENYIVGVRPGNTTALNAAYDPFAAYVAAFHRHLHREFAFRFLGGLPLSGELNDPQLMTKVEIVVNPDGTLHRLGVVQSSGQTMFDFGAFNAVKNGEPYPQPPSHIRSADGRVYMRWALHRDHSQCGTWNAEMYLVKDPPDVGEDTLPTPGGMTLEPRRPGPG